MPQTYSALRDAVEAQLQDSSNAVYSPAEIDTIIADQLRQMALTVPHIVKVLYQFEGRYGTTTATTASYLEDSTKSQFASTDVGKVVYNSTDKTWAVITSYSSTSKVGVSNDIFASGESYKIFNKQCLNSKQINREDVIDALWVDCAEFPVGNDPPTLRPIDSDENNIVTVGYDYPIGDTNDTNTDKLVYLYFAKRHKVSQLTDFAGAVNNAGGYSEGATSMAINGLQTSGTIEEGQEFTITGVLGTYTVTAAATIATNAATVSFYPGLHSDVAHTTVVTFSKSSLTPFLENILVELTTGNVAISKASQPMMECVNAIANLATASTAIGLATARLTQAVTDIASGRTEADRASALITTSAAGEFALMNTEIDQAVADLDAGRALINTIPTAYGAENDYMQQASSVINTAIGYMRTGQSYIQQAQADQKTAESYLSLAKVEINSANADVSKGIGYLNLINSHLSVARSSLPLVQWGQAKVEKALKELRKLATPRGTMSRR